MISSGVYRFLGMTLTSLVTVQSNIHPGPNLPGQVTTNAAGQADAGLPVALGGRIVQASRNGKGIVIVAEHLPIVNHPVDGPTEDVKRTGDYEFAFLYPGELEPQDLRNGNRFVMVGTTTSRRPVVVNGVPKTEPFLIADCIHVWQTGRAEIAEFKDV